MFLSTVDTSLRRSTFIIVCLLAQPFSGLVGEVAPTLFCLLTRLAQSDFSHYCLFLQDASQHLGCLIFLASQPCPIWIFTWGLRSVDEVPLNFLMSLVFLEGVLKLSENFQLFPRKLDDLYHMIYSGVSNIISGSDIYPIISWQSLQDLFPLFSLLYWGGLRSYIRRTVSLSWAVSLEVFYQTSIKFCPLKKKVLAGCFPSIQKDF